MSEKIKTTIRPSQKRGAYLAVQDYETDRLIAWLAEHDKHIAEDIPAEQKQEVLAAFDNFQTLLKMKAQGGAIDRISLRVPQTLKKEMNRCFELAAAHNIQFHPSDSMIQTLIDDIKGVLKQIGEPVPDFPNVKENKKAKHDITRKIFIRMLDGPDTKGFKTIYDRIAAQEFGKKSELQHLHNVKYGKSTPPIWSYVVALKTLNELDIDVFNIDVPQEMIFELWYGGHKAFMDKKDIYSKFVQVFKTRDDLQKAFKTFLDQQPNLPPVDEKA